jgi:hypothetical protein
MRTITPAPVINNRIASAQTRILQQRVLFFLFRVSAVVLGGGHAWAASAAHSMNPDGINYLDMGDAYLRGDWGMALNSVWSPLYSWILGGVMKVFQPGMRWEFPLVHLTNFAVFLAALLSFEFLLRQMLAAIEPFSHDHTEKVGASLPAWIFVGITYSLFIWASLALVKIWSVNPDMLVSAIVYLAAGLIVRIRNGSSGWGTYVLLGLVLGAGFLAKAAMLVLGFVFLAAALLSSRSFYSALPRLALGLGVYLLISLSFIGLVSAAKGRLAYGDAGTLTYIKYVNGIPYPHWQGEVPGFGTPDHPSRKILDTPPVYEFSFPVGGTYPIAYDPAYWYEGIIPNYHVGELVRAVTASGMFYFDLFIRQQAALITGVFILTLLAPRKRHSLQDQLRRYALIIPSLVAFGLYALIYVEGRYIAPFIVVLWAGILADQRLPSAEQVRRQVPLLAGVIVLFIWGNLLFFNLTQLGAFNSRLQVPTTADPSSPPSWPGEVAQELHRLGIVPDSKVGVIGYAFDSYWARLARVQIVAEMFSWEAYPFWLGDKTVQADVLHAFQSAGAQAVVAEGVPGFISPNGWQQVGQSSYYIYVIHP